jgi:hypothetical protein
VKLPALELHLFLEVLLLNLVRAASIVVVGARPCVASFTLAIVVEVAV